MFEFTDKKNELDFDGYLSFCDANFNKLNDDEKGQFTSAAVDIFEPTTPEQKKALSNMLRKYVATLPANA